MNEQRPNLEGLRIFAIQHDRGESPIFVGRERETEHILLQAESIGAAHAAGRGTEGATIVISGCPGSGKSAFLKYFARAFSTLELTNTVLVPALCTHHALGARNEDELKAQLAKLAIENKGGGHKILQTLAAEVGKKLKVEETLKRLEEKITKDWGRRTVVCLLVDEIQNVTDENRVALELLHTRSLSPPVLPIYAGLDDSVEQLQRVGRISRLSDEARMTMGPLRENAAKEAAGQLFDNYRVRSDGPTRRAWAQAIEDEALDFAQHLHSALKSASGVLVAGGGTARAEDITQVREGTRTRRERYYAEKLDATLAGHGKAILDVVARATRTSKPLVEDDLAMDAAQAMQKHRPRPSGYDEHDGLTLIKQVRRRGILHLTAEGRAEVPIPSLRTWLMGPYAAHIGWTPDRRGNKRRRGGPGTR